MKRSTTLVGAILIVVLAFGATALLAQMTSLPQGPRMSLAQGPGPHGPHGPRGPQGRLLTEAPASVEQVPRLTKEAVREMIGKPDVVLVDVRYIKQYEQSGEKIPGAVFVQPENFDEFVKNHPKEKTYVLY